MATFAERLKFLRKKRKLTQQEIADKIGISRVGYGYWEKGTREPSIDNLVELSKLLGTSLDYLLGYNDYNFVDTNEIMSIMQGADEEQRKDIMKQTEDFTIRTLLFRVMFTDTTYDDIKTLLKNNNFDDETIDNTIAEAKKYEKLYINKQTENTLRPNDTKHDVLTQN